MYVVCRNLIPKLFYIHVNIFIQLFFFSTIAKPFDGRMTYGRALLLLIVLWTYVTPWCVLPLVEQWNRYVPGQSMTPYFSRNLYTSTFKFKVNISKNHIKLIKMNV